MTYHGLPPAPGSGWIPPAPDPGPVPLRPLTVGDVLAVGFGVVRRHFALLAPIAVLLAAAASAISIGILASSGSLDEFVGAQWFEDVLQGRRSSLPAGMYWATGLSSVVSVLGAMVMAGVATACAGVDAMGRMAVRGAVAERLRGRWPTLIGTAVLVGVAVSVGLVLLIVPGVLIYLAWAVATPVSTMERASTGAALKRSIALTRGFRGRILGVTILIILVTYIIDLVVSSAALAIAGPVSPVVSLIVSDAAGAVASAVTLSWLGAVMAVLYIDIRIRKENLAPALRAFAAARPGT